MSDEVNNTPPETLGQGLRRLRLARELTQRELIVQAQTQGPISGMIETGVSHWESDRRVPMPAQLYQVFQVLQPTAEDALALLQRIQDYRYVGVLHIISSSGGSPEEKLAQWAQWAQAYPGHPARGRPWQTGSGAREGAPSG